MSAVESNRLREVSKLADRAWPAPAATQEGHQVWPPNSTEQSWQTYRPHWWQAATARLAGWSKQAASPSSAASASGSVWAEARTAGKTFTRLLDPHKVHTATSPAASSHFGKGMLQRAQGTGMIGVSALAPDHTRAADQVVQPASFGIEASHDIANAGGEQIQPLGKVAAGGASQAQLGAIRADHPQFERQLSGRRTETAADKEGLVGATDHHIRQERQPDHPQHGSENHIGTRPPLWLPHGGQRTQQGTLRDAPHHHEDCAIDQPGHEADPETGIIGSGSGRHSLAQFLNVAILAIRTDAHHPEAREIIRRVGASALGAKESSGIGSRAHFTVIFTEAIVFSQASSSLPLAPAAVRVILYCSTGAGGLPMVMATWPRSWLLL